MRLTDNKKYISDLEKYSGYDLDWAFFSGKSIAISGGTGMIGSYLADLLMYRNITLGQNTKVYILGRNKEKFENRFAGWIHNEKTTGLISFIEADISKKIESDIRPDFVIHAASATHPRAYATDPIGTISANVMGTNNLLEWCSEAAGSRFMFLSSVEIYGENRGDKEKFDENYLGFIDCNTMRAGYPESKRAGEALCQAYIAQKGLDAVTLRLSRVYGPTMLLSDSKALSQFILKGVARENIVLKSAGTQYYSYSYVGDVAVAILFGLLKLKTGSALNMVSSDSDVYLKDIASFIAEAAGTEVVFDLPDAVEAAGYSTATTAILDGSRFNELGFRSVTGIKEGLRLTVDIVRELGN